MTDGARHSGDEGLSVNAAAAAAASDAANQRAVDAVLSMLRQSPAATRREVHRLLAAELAAPPTAAQLRVAELGYLSSLIASDLDDGFEFAECERTYYDEVRPTAVPSSRHLVDCYGSWSRACRAAYGVQLDGTSTGPGKPWPTMSCGEPKGADYTRDEAIAAINLCAKELRCAGLAGVPTSWQYDEWVRRRKLKAKKRGGGGGRTLRLPYAHNIYRLFPSTGRRGRGQSRWQAIVAAAGLIQSPMPKEVFSDVSSDKHRVRTNVRTDADR